MLSFCLQEKHKEDLEMMQASSRQAISVIVEEYKVRTLFVYM